MSLWKSNPHQSSVDLADDLAHQPSGGPVKMWLAGAGLPTLAVGYGVKCLAAGRAIIPGRGASLEVFGETATAVSIAYIAIGAFIHFHYFWGLHPRLIGLSGLLKFLSLLVFLVSFGIAIFGVLG